MIGWLDKWRSRGQRQITYAELREACLEKGCPICRLVSQSETRYLNMLLYEGVGDPDIRDAIRRTGGFCPIHGRAIAEAGDNLPVAILCQDLTNHLVALLSAAQTSPGVEVPALPSPTVGCQICAAGRDATGRYLQALLEIVEDASAAQALRESGGLCLSHLGQALALGGSRRRLATIMEVQRYCMESLHQELGEFIRKKDYRYASEKYGQEGDSWLRALRLISGLPPQMPLRRLR